MFSFWREFISSFGFLSLIGFFFIEKLPSFDYQYCLILFLSLSISALQRFIKNYYKKEFDAGAYLSSVLGVAVFSTLISFSYEELVEFGFHLKNNSDYFSLKLLLSFWSIIWLPIALDKFFRNRWF
ncbi:hypothetical protein [Actinobacillus pleuropneumoniae]|uniref:hypothetical protein n=1 Tax=Actinobacillus pleuropneumoniae TaxID=715 RepID=UPI003B98339F